MTDHPAPAHAAKTIRGRVVPSVGIGTFEVGGADGIEAVAHALALGYRHVDTAKIYGNEREVGEGIRQAGTPREDLWLTTKIWMDDFAPARLRESTARSLDLLGTGHVDLMLLHWPPADASVVPPALETLEAMREEGLISEFGVSNFTPSQLEDALVRAPELFANQVEFHPHLHQRRLLEIAEEKDVLVEAYAPLGSGKGVLDDPLLAEIAAVHEATPAQVALAWLLSHEQVVVLPRSTSDERRTENLAAQHLDLTDDEVERLSANADATHTRHFNPPFAPVWED